MHILKIILIYTFFRYSGTDEAEFFPAVLVGNKSDLSAKRDVSLEEVIDWCTNKRPQKQITYLECSAKLNIGVSDVFNFITHAHYDYALSPDEAWTETDFDDNETDYDEAFELMFRINIQRKLHRKIQKRMKKNLAGANFTDGAARAVIRSNEVTIFAFLYFLVRLASMKYSWLDCCFLFVGAPVRWLCHLLICFVMLICSYHIDGDLVLLLLAVSCARSSSSFGHASVAHHRRTVCSV